MPPHRKASAVRTRMERLRERRNAAQTLRVASPTATLIGVQLKFHSVTKPLHAPQSFVLYPPARALFEFPCPYGDCDGIYDFGPEAKKTFSRDKSGVTGSVECGGQRFRGGLQRQTCGLRVDYEIKAEHEPA